MLCDSGNSGHFNALVLVIILAVLQLFSSMVAATTGSKVEYLPGLQHDGPLPFHLETGYIGVGEGEEVQAFYYFVKSERDPTNDPLIMWIPGGPGCSALFTFSQEIGPVSMDVVRYIDGLPTLSLNPNSWTKVASFLYVELPVRTGFSYATTKRANESNNLQESEHAHQFIRKWFIGHPEYLANPFYVGGDSYSGIVIPIVTHIISDGNEAGIKPWINLKGYILGNPLTKDVANVYYYSAIAAYRMNLIPEDFYQSLVKNCDGKFIPPKNELCLREFNKFSEFIQGIYPEQIQEAPCVRYARRTTNELDGQRRFLSDKPKLPEGILCWAYWYNITDHWANDDSVQEALHIRKGSIGHWSRCSYYERSSFETTVLDVVPYHANLSARGYRALVYSGDHDIIIPPFTTEAWIRSLNYSVVDNWRPWTIDGLVAGYTRSYSNNMTFATIKGSGHVAPFFTPYECSAMFKRWISGEKL